MVQWFTLEWKFAFITVATVICNGRKLKSSVLTFTPQPSNMPEAEKFC